MPLAYGGIHLTAWGYAFPSVAESLCWKATCLIIMVCISLAGLVIKFNVPNSNLFKYLYWVALSFLWILFLSAKMTFLLESFISLRHIIPIGAYAAVPWVQNFTHV